MRNTGGIVHKQSHQRGDHSLDEIDLRNPRKPHQHDIQAGIVRRMRALRKIDHEAHENVRQRKGTHAKKAMMAMPK